MKVDRPKEILVRTSERTTYTRCRQKWWWAYVDCLRPDTTAPALKFGDLVHQSLAIYYKNGRARGPHPAETFVKLYDSPDVAGFHIRQEDDRWEDARELGVDMLERYVEHYHGDRHLIVLASEQPFQVDITSSKGSYLFTATGILDAIIKDARNGQIGILETKTAKTISVNHLPLDEQAGSYWAFAPKYLRKQGVLEPGKNIDFILYNFLRKAKRDPRPRDEKGRCLNKDGSVSKIQPSPYFLRYPVYRSSADRINLIRRAAKQAREMELVKAGKLAVYKNPTRDCSWDCGFKDMCELHETGSDWEELRDLTMGKWDPYQEHDMRIDMDPEEEF